MKIFTEITITTFNPKSGPDYGPRTFPGFQGSFELDLRQIRFLKRHKF
jgi:hypothetical protein